MKTTGLVTEHQHPKQKAKNGTGYRSSGYFATIYQSSSIEG